MTIGNGTVSLFRTSGPKRITEMRYKLKEPKRKLGYSVGDTRIRRSFLFFPKLIEREWRWLETATWIEIAYEASVLFVSPQVKTLKWTGVCWGRRRIWQVGGE